MSKTAITYTDAPDSYDGFGTRTVEFTAHSPRGVIRKVETPAEHADWQRTRYASGLYLVVTDGPTGCDWERIRNQFVPLLLGERLSLAAPAMANVLAWLAERFDGTDAVMEQIEAVLRLAGRRVR